MIAIHTKFIPASNTKPSRIKAYICNNHKPVIISFDHKLSDIEAHAKAARILLDREIKYAPNYETMAYGGSADGRGYTFCFVQSIIAMPRGE